MNTPIVTEPRPPRYTECVDLEFHQTPRELAYLDSLNEVKVLQQLDEYEALFLKTIFQRRNRYYITDGEERAFYFAKEVTKPAARLCCNSRAMELHIRDDYGATLMILRRPLRCSASCWWWCCLQHVEVEYPLGIVCAYIRENWTPWWASMDIVHPEGETLYKVRGTWCGCKLRCHNYLEVTDPKTKQTVATYHKVCHGCSDCFAGLNDFSVQYNDNVTAKDKLLLLGAAFIVDLVYLEHRTY